MVETELQTPKDYATDLCRFGHHQVTNGCCPSRLTEDCDPIFVATKEMNIIMDPFKRQDHVKQAHVACTLLCVQTEEAKRPQAIVYGDHNDISNLAKTSRVVDKFCSLLKGSAVHKEHHWQFGHILG